MCALLRKISFFQIKYRELSCEDLKFKTTLSTLRKRKTSQLIIILTPVSSHDIFPLKSAVLELLSEMQSYVIKQCTIINFILKANTCINKKHTMCTFNTTVNHVLEQPTVH